MRKNVLPSRQTAVSQKQFFTGILLSGCLSLTLVSFLCDGQARLVKDLATEFNYNNENHHLMNGGNAMYFTDIRVLWKSNGKRASTVRLGDFPRKGILNLTRVGDAVFFTSDDGSNNSALWKTDGTPTGTVKIKSLGPSHLPSPRELVNVNGTLFFVATTPGLGTELWKSDGTTDGTVIVKDIRPSGSSNPSSLTWMRGKLFFSANDGINGHELWTSDGTHAGTRMVKDIRPGSFLGSNPSELVNVRGTLFFSATDGTTGRELWKSNGTTGGTVFVKDIRPGAGASGIENTTNVNGKLFFTADDGVHGDELWRSDGSASGTVLVKDLNPGKPGSNNTGPRPFPMGSFTDINGILFFTASIGTNDYLYRSDGTPAGTFIIQPANGANNFGLTPAFRYLNGYVYFFNPTSSDSSGVDVLWKMPYNGRRPVAVKEFSFDQEFFADFYQELITFNGALYFFARPDINSGLRLMTSDGTTVGTRVVQDPRLSSEPAEIVRVNDLLYIRTFPRSTGERGQLYRTNGTAAGTFSYGTMRENEEMVAIGNKLFFTARDTFASGLFVTEGTLESTERLLPGSVAGRVAFLLTEVNGLLYYHNDEGELWRTNGTPDGEVLVGHLGNIHSITDVNGQAFILASPDQATLELWRTNAAGSLVKVKTISTNFFMPPLNNLTTRIGRIFYFVASDGVHGEEIWRSDGTTAGTFMMFNIRTTDETGEVVDFEDDIRTLTVHNNKLFFSAKSDDNSWAWYQAVGNRSFVKLADMPPVKRTVVNNALIHLMTESMDGSANVELWVSDGTQQGTRFLTSVEGGGPADHGIVDNIVYFSTREGKQMIRTDGTECGTFAVNTGVQYAFPLESLGNDMIFGGFTPSTGMEPFIYRSINRIIPPEGCLSSAVAMIDSGANSSLFITPYPNPFPNDFTLRINATDQSLSSVSVFTTSGLPVETLKGIKPNTDYPHVGALWPKGIYVLKVYAMGELRTYMVVKQ